MDLTLIILFLFGGILLGFILDSNNLLLQLADFITKFALGILLLAMGANLGANDEVLLHLGQIGFQAFIFAAAGIIFSILAVVIFARKMGLKNFLLETETSNSVLAESSAESKMSILIFASVVTGILLGIFILNAAWQELAASIIDYSLALLLFGVGMDIGDNRKVLVDLKLIGWKVILIPILIALGTIVGSIFTGLLFGLSTGEAAAVGSGFGWYSLSGVIISNLHSAELGSLAFLTNVFRELLTVMILPFVAKYFGSLAVIAPGGATTMDVTLPLVKESGGEAVVIPAFVSGVVLSSLVPILVPLFLNL